MLSRNLGNNGPRVSALGLGCMGMTAFYSGRGSEQDHHQVLLKAIELGCTFWDSADVYTTNEEMLASFFKANPGTREKVFLCTKFALVWDPQDAKELGCDMWSVCGKPSYVRKCAERSLKRLGVDCIDLYYQHRVDTNTPIEETVGEMSKLVKEGKVKYLGLSECSAATLRKAHAVHPIAAVQIEYSPWTLDIEQNDLLATARELGVAIVAYSPVGRGFLTGKFQKFEDLPEDDWRRQNPRFMGENFTKNLEIVKRFEELAKEMGGFTPSQVCLSWLMAQGNDIIPIPGTTKVKNLEENWASVNIKLTDDQLQSVRKIVESIGVQGTRYPASNSSSLNK